MESTFTEPVIFHKVSQLYRLVHDRVSRFPKTSRHTLGVRIELTIIEIIEYLYLAHSKRGNSRLLILNRVDVQLRVLFMHLRLAHSTRCLNDAGFAEISTMAVEIGKMLGGWMKQTKAHEGKS